MGASPAQPNHGDSGTTNTRFIPALHSGGLQRGHHEQLHSCCFYSSAWLIPDPDTNVDPDQLQVSEPEAVYSPFMLNIV